MPIYEYLCNDCERPFEELVLSASTAVACPICKGTDIHRLMSVVNTVSAHETCSGDGACAMGMPPPGGCCGGGACGNH